ncbi:NAD(P)-dependent oxidoreductase [Corynebacterium suedekumii]|nr:NAD(P)-dependent oxidoreductase [Corynebacterium suedekumii]
MIINAARGGLVDEQALADAIRSGHIWGAGFDVYATEPCTDSPLFGASRGRGDPAPGCVHRRGPGPCRHRRRRLRAQGPGRRVRPGRRQRLRWPRRRGGRPVAGADPQARPAGRSPARLRPGCPRGRGPRRAVHRG